MLFLIIQMTYFRGYVNDTSARTKSLFTGHLARSRGLSALPMQTDGELVGRQARMPAQHHTAPAQRIQQLVRGEDQSTLKYLYSGERDVARVEPAALQIWDHIPGEYNPAELDFVPSASQSSRVCNSVAV